MINVSSLSSSIVFPINISNIRVYLDVSRPGGAITRHDKQMIAVNINANISQIDNAEIFKPNKAKPKILMIFNRCKTELNSSIFVVEYKFSEVLLPDVVVSNKNE
jgi:hypothetical protein